MTKKREAVPFVAPVRTEKTWAVGDICWIAQRTWQQGYVLRAVPCEIVGLAFPNKDGSPMGRDVAVRNKDGLSLVQSYELYVSSEEALTFNRWQALSAARSNHGEAEKRYYRAVSQLRSAREELADAEAIWLKAEGKKARKTKMTVELPAEVPEETQSDEDELLTHRHHAGQACQSRLCVEQGPLDSPAQRYAVRDRAQLCPEDYLRVSSGLR